VEIGRLSTTTEVLEIGLSGVFMFEIGEDEESSAMEL
jgi:hypothetical protein